MKSHRRQSEQQASQQHVGRRLPSATDPFAAAKRSQEDADREGEQREVISDDQLKEELPELLRQLVQRGREESRPIAQPPASRTANHLLGDGGSQQPSIRKIQR